MTDICFKAWHKEKQEMFDVLVIDMNINEVFLDKFSDMAMISGRLEEVHFWISFNDVILCQFTNLRDMCGNKVFENDVVSLADGTLFEVFREMHCFKLKNINSEHVIDINHTSFDKEFVIKGNKFSMFGLT